MIGFGVVWVYIRVFVAYKENLYGPKRVIFFTCNPKIIKFPSTFGRNIPLFAKLSASLIR